MPLRATWLALCLLPWTTGCKGKEKPPPPPPPGVTVAPVVREDVPLFVESVGSLDGYVNAEIRARVQGYLKSQNYSDGTRVGANQLLFTIEPTEYQASVSAAQGSLGRAEALQANARIQLERSKHLFETGSVPPQDVDNATAALKDAEGQVRAARAALEQAELNLSYTQVRSPIDGIAGIALVRIGNLVGKNEPTLLTTVSQIDPVRANFTMSEVDYVRFPDRLKHYEGRDLPWAKAQFKKLERGLADGDDPGVELVLADDSTYAHRGVVVTADRQIDTATGTIQLQALFPNPDGALRPGQFVRVRSKRPDEGRAVLVVPERALIPVQGAYSVGVVGADSKVSLRKVTVGPSAGGRRIVESGVSEGDKVVVDGVQKIRDGVVVHAEPAQETSITSAPAPSGAPGEAAPGAAPAPSGAPAPGAPPSAPAPSSAPSPSETGRPR